MVCICRHSLYSEKYQRFQRTYIFVIVPDILHVVIFGLRRIYAQLFFFYLLFKFNYCLIIEIYVCYCGKKTFKHKNVGIRVGTSLLCRSCKSYKRARKLVLIICRVALFAADACLAVAARIMRGLLTLKTKHLFHIHSSVYIFYLYILFLSANGRFIRI